MLINFFALFQEPSEESTPSYRGLNSRPFSANGFVAHATDEIKNFFVVYSEYKFFSYCVHLFRSHYRLTWEIIIMYILENENRTIHMFVYEVK